jgi:hypothetical protein
MERSAIRALFPHPAALHAGYALGLRQAGE